MAVVLILFVLAVIAIALRPVKPTKATFSFEDIPVELTQLPSSPVEILETQSGFEAKADKSTISYSAQAGLNLNIENRTPLSVNLASDNNFEVNAVDNKISYVNSDGGYTIQYSTFKQYIKEDIILTNSDSTKEFVFQINTDSNNQLIKNEDGGIKIIKNSKLQYYIYPPVAWDTQGKTINYEYDVSDNQIKLKPTNLSEFDNVIYPVTIDPTISWIFLSDINYIISDPEKIEIAEEVVRLTENEGAYATDSPYVISTKSLKYTTLSGFLEELGSNNQGTIQYQISNNFLAWFNPSWNYRKKISLTGISSNQNDFQTRIVLDTASLISGGKMQSACQDLRIVNRDNEVLPYWIETGTNGCNTSSTNVWVKVPSISVEGITLFIYYGNSSASSLQNGESVFLFFDDFSSGSLNASKWTATGGTSISSGELTITTGSVYSNSTITATNQNTLFEMRARWAASQTAYSGISISNANSIAGSNGNSNKLAMLMSNSTSSIAQLAFGATGISATYDVVNSVAQYTPTANTYYMSGFSFDTTTLRFYQNRFLTNSYSDTAEFAPYLILGYFTGSAAATTNTTDTTIDFVLARKFVTTEPGMAFDAEESVTGDNWYWWNGSNWALTTGGFEASNTASDINDHISSFSSEIGTGNFTFKAFLHAANSSQQVELSNVTVTYFSETAPVVSSLSESTGSSIGNVDVTISGLNFAQGLETKTFTYTGADQTYTVPAGVTSIKVKMWGGGGGGGNKGGWHFGYDGGGGGYVEADLAVTPGQVLTVMVGAGGVKGTTGSTVANYGGGGPNCGGSDCQYGGQGGGRSAIRLSGEDILTAGGGGGGGSRNGVNSFAHGGGGGGTVGQDGLADANTASLGKGGTQSAGGAAGTGTGAGATAGSKYLGGRPNTPSSYGGSGGGGWYGGGAGAYQGTVNIMGGGGGGSSYIGDPKVSHALTIAGNRSTQGNSGDLDNGGAGKGGSPNIDGQSGKVIIDVNPKAVTFGGIPARNVRFIDSSTITVTVPAHEPGTVDVSVINPDGQTATLEDAYTYVGPTIDSINVVSGSTMGATDVTISGSFLAEGVETKIYDYTGADQTYTVPAGVTSIKVKMWGGGGGGGNLGVWTYGFPGGGGGYTEADLAVTPGQVLTVMVGAGGNKATSGNTVNNYGGGGINCGNGTDCRYGGQGGGRSAIRLNSDDLITAGGGGGGGATNGQIYDESGGGGGGATAEDGKASEASARAGKGGTPSAGGAAGTGSSAGASAGTKYYGGRPNAEQNYGGSGGGGWYGGGGGAYQGVSMGGGGGGSSYVSGAGVSNGIMLGALGRLQANLTNPYNNGAGLGGLTNANGTAGRVVIEALPATVLFGDTPATNIQFIDSETIVATSPAHAEGAVDITVTNPDGASATLSNAFTYNKLTVASISPSTDSTAGGEQVTITGTDFSKSVLTTTFEFVTADQTYIVPDGVETIKVKMWGGGGGGGNKGSWNYGYPGGGGGYTESEIAVTPGQVLTVMVGAGGGSGTSSFLYANYGGGGRNCTTGTCQFGGAGGGRSAIRYGGEDILTAGGGGGGGSSRSTTLRQNGGGGGGLTAQKGLAEDNALAGGNPGTQVAGGTAYTGNTAGVAGSKYAGGGHNATNTHAGAGGGGWYGGATGTYREPNTMGGGGGGSSYIGYENLINPIALRGNLNIQANAADSDNGGAGAGGAENSAGQPGKVIITAYPVKVLIGGIEAKEVQFIDDTTITAKVPANAAGPMDVTVVNPDGTSAVLEGGFTYIDPSLSSVEPNNGPVLGGTEITINGENFTKPETIIYDFSGGDQTYTVPSGVTSIRVKMWGAAGGGGNPGGTFTNGYPGGGGGYTEADLEVTPGQALTVMVGDGGHGGNLNLTGRNYGDGGASCNSTDCQYAAQGGGRSAIRISGEDILTAGGGGGGGVTRNNTNDETGGGGGGLVAENGKSGIATVGGKGGSQSAGGAGGVGSNTTGNAGAKYLGGNPGGTQSYGGGGGGGWYGGGAGGYGSDSMMGGGGGGSSYFGSLQVDFGFTLRAVANTQANAADADNGGAGKGGLPSEAGRTGRVIITTNPTKVEVGGLPARVVRYVDSETITAIVPSNTIGAKDIVVTDANGTVNTLENSFNYTGSSVSSIDPVSGTGNGGTEVTITGSGLAASLSTEVFNYTGTDQKFVVPEGVTSVLAKMWGGGGGGGSPGGWTYGYPGGGGGYTTSIIPVTPGQELTIMVGAGGVPGGTSPTNNFYGGAGNNCNGNCVYGGQGGGRSAIRISGEDILTAGGGGGGGSSRSNILLQNGGAGGGLIGQDGISLEILLAAGRGGTQTAGGSNGVAGGGNGSAGSKYTGGNTFNSYGGSGGGGWYGGGAGSYQETNTMGGGGGGSSYIAYGGLINPIALRGNFNTQANASDSDNGGAGAGGAAATAGNPGKVIISAAPLQVLFGENRAKNVRWIDENTVVATTPANASGIEDITVVTPDGQTYTLTEAFTFTPPPSINSVDPSSVFKTGGATVTISGNNFKETPVVKFDGIESENVEFIDSNTLTAVVPEHTLGSVSIEVINPDGDIATLYNGITYIEVAPIVNDITPDAGPTAGGTEVSISGTNFSESQSSLPSYIKDGLLIYYPMNSDSGTSVLDASGSSINGVSTNASISSGYTGDSRNFNGSNAYITVNGSLDVPFNNSPFTVSAWINPANHTAARDIICWGQSSVANNYNCFRLGNTGGIFQLVHDFGSNALTVTTSNLTSTWAYVSLTFDGTTRKMYLNGSLIGSDTPTNVNVRPTNVFVGSRPGLGEYFSGKIDEILVYNRALSSTEIQANYSVFNNTAYLGGLHSYFQMDESSGQDLINSTGSPPTAFLGATTSEGSDDPSRIVGGSDCKSLGCLSFDGTNDLVNLNSTFYQSTTLSVSMWFKTTDTNAGLLGYQNALPGGSVTSHSPPLYIMPDGKLRAEFYTGATSQITTAGAVNDGQWHLATLTGAGNTQSFYLDGNLVGTRSGTISWAWWTTTTIGTAYVVTGRGAPTNDWQYLNGLIDDVRIYSRALNSTDVGNLYSSGLNGVAGNRINVLLGEIPAEDINFVDSETINAVTPENSGGLVDVTVVNPDGQSGTLEDGFRYFFDKFSIVSLPQTVRATEPATFIVQAQDIDGNAIILDTDVTLDLSTTSMTGFFAINLAESESTRWDHTSVVVSAGTSNATFYYKDNQKGTPTITAAPDGGSSSLPATQEITIKSKYQLLVTGVTNPIKVGVPSSVTVISTDYLGSPQHDYQGTIEFSSTDPAALLPSEFTYELSMLGEHTFVNGVTMVTQGEFCVTATDSQDSDITGSQCGIVVNPPDEGNIAQLKILNGTQTIPLDGMTTEITVQAQDTNGTGIPVQEITPIYFYTDSETGEFSINGTSWFSGPFATEISAYATSKNFFYRDPTLGPHTIVVRDDSVENSDGSGPNVGWENDSVIITTAVGSAHKLVLTGVPSTLTAGEVSSAISISMQDIEGNNLTATQDKTVYLTSNTNSILFSVDGVSDFVSSLSTKIKTGDLLATVYIKSTVKGAANITLSDASPADGDTGLLDNIKAITINSAAPNKLVLTNSPSEVIAGDVSDVFTAQLQDEFNNPITVGSNFPLYLSSSNTDSLFSLTSFGSTVTTINILTGNDSVNFYFKQNKYFETQTVYVSDTAGGPGSGGVADTQTVVNILTGSASKIEILEASPYSAIAGQPAGPFTAAIKNTFNVEIPIGSDIPLYFYTNSTATVKEFSLDDDPWEVVTGYTLQSGNSRFTFYYKDNKIGSATIRVSDDNNPSFEFGLTNASIDLNVGAATASSVKFTSSSQTAVAGVATGAITVALYDQFNNQTTSVGDTVINLSSSSGTGRFDTQSNGAFSGSITSITIPNGQGTGTFYYKDVTIGTPTITLSSDGLTGATQDQTIQAGTITRFEITSTSNSVAAGSVLDKLTLSVYNAGNVNIPAPTAFSINLSTSHSAGRFDTNILGSFNGSITSVVVPMNQTHVDFYYKDTTAGTATITASKMSFSNATKEINVLAGEVTKLAFKNSLPELSIGQKSNAIVIQSRDEFGNPAVAESDTTIYLYSTSAEHEFYNAANDVITNIVLQEGANEVSIYYKDFVYGSATLSISDYEYPDSPDEGLTNASDEITIVYGAPAKIQLSSNAEDIQVGVPVLLTLKLLNAYDQVVPAVGDTVINLQSTSGSGKFDTNSEGSFEATSVTVPNGSSSVGIYYKDTLVGNPIVSAIKSGWTTGTYQFNLLSSTIFSLAFAAAPQSIVAGVASSQYVILFKDQYGNYTTANTQLIIDLESEELAGSFAESSSGPWTISSVEVEAGAADARFYYKDTVAGTKQISVASDPLVGASQNVSVTANEPASMNFVPDTPQTVAGQIASEAITVVLFDEYGNVAKPSNLLTLNLSSDSEQYQFSSTVSPWTPITSINISTSSSQTIFYYKDWFVGNPTITVSDNADTLDPIQIQFEIVASDASKIIIDSLPSDTLANTPTPSITFFIADSNDYKTQLNSETDIHITSSSEGGQFSADGGNTWYTDLIITIPADSDTSKSFIYVDSVEGNPEITISAAGLTSATQIQTILAGNISKVAILGESTVSAGQILELTIRTLNEDDEPVSVQSDTVLTLDTTSASGEFSLSNSEWIPIDTVTLNQWQNQKVIYYRDETSGAATITVNAQEDQGWDAGIKNITVEASGYYRIMFLSKPASVVADEVSDSFVVQTVDQFGNIVDDGDRTVYVHAPASSQLSLNGESFGEAPLELNILNGNFSGTFYYKDIMPGNKNITVSDHLPLDTPDIDIINATASIEVEGQVPVRLQITTQSYTGENNITAGTFTGVITIQALKENDTPAIIGEPLTVNLSTDPSLENAFKLAASSEAGFVTSTVIPTGATSVNIYFITNISGTYTMSFSSEGLDSDTQDVEVTAAAAHHFKFLTGAQVKGAGVESSQFRVALQDEFNNFAILDTDLAVNLSSTSVTGKFSALNDDDWADITQITLYAGNSDIYFYYKDSIAGIYTLTLDEVPSQGIVAATQSFTVTAGSVVSINFQTSANTLEVNQASNVISVALKDVYGNTTAAESDTTLYLYTSSTDGLFGNNDNFGSLITQVVINSGSSAASFYYKDANSGNPVLTVSDQNPLDDPDTGITNATQTQTINWGSVTELKFTNANSSVAAGSTKLLELRFLNNYGGIVESQEAITIYLSTTGSGQFATSSNFEAGQIITEYTIPVNQTGLNIYYKDTVSGSITVTASDVSRPAEQPDTGLVNAVQTFTVQPASLSNLVFITIPQTLVVGQVSNQMSVQARDVFGNITTVEADTNLYLYTTSPTGQFSASTDFSSGNLITHVTLNPGASSISFYYKDLTYVAPNSQPQIKVSNQFPNPSTDDAIADAIQMQTVNAGNISQMSFTSTDLGVTIAGTPAAPITAIFKNQYGVEIPLTAAKLLYFFSSLGGSQFATWNGSSCGSFGIASVEIAAPNSRFTFCYKSSLSGSSTITVSDTTPATPDTGWTNATGTIVVDAGDITQIVFNNSSPLGIVARHTSAELKIEAQNQYGNPTAVSGDKTIFLRSTSGTGEFALSAGGPWGINFATISSGQKGVSVYYRDSTVTGGSPLTLTAADSLPLIPDTGWTNGTLSVNITQQVVNNFLVTNISDPQIQGNASSVVVMARDSENYVVDWYTGTISFSSSDGNAVLPDDYTFTPADKGLKTFVNGVAFSVTGEHSVTVTDGQGITGTQNNITVNPNPAGPITQVRFKDVPNPLLVQKDRASAPITVQLRDATGIGSNAGVGGFTIKLSSTSGTAEFSLSPDGPWSSTGIFTVPQNFNAINVYHRDSTTGNFTLTVSDWVSGSDDVGISNDTASVKINTIIIHITTDLEVNNNTHFYVDSPIIFAKQDDGDFTAKVEFQIATSDAIAGTPKSADLVINWKNPAGTIIQTASPTNVSSYVFTVPQFEGTVSETNYQLEINAAAADGSFDNTAIVNIPVSGWTVKVDYNPNNINLGQPIEFTIETRHNGTLQDVSFMSVNIKDNNGDNVEGSEFIKYLGDLTHTATGKYSGTLSTDGLSTEDPYYLYARIYNDADNTLAEDNNNDIFLENRTTSAPKNFGIQKILTSEPPAAEEYNLQFNWGLSEYALKYNLYRSTDKTTPLFADTCSIENIASGHRFGNSGATEPFCEEVIDQIVDSDDTTSWVKMATINAPSNTYTIPWQTIQDELSAGTYYFVLRAENYAGESGYSTMLVALKRNYSFNESLANTNWISIPYNTVYTKASDIVNELEGATSAGTNTKINTVMRWIANSQDVESYKYNPTLGKWVGTDFNINAGDGISLILSGQTESFNWTIAGSDKLVPKTLTLNSAASNINWLSVPYTTKLLTASDIVAQLEGSQDSNQKINSISLWNAQTQSISSYTYSEGSWMGIDFVVNPGDGISITLSGNSESINWSPYLIINPKND